MNNFNDNINQWLTCLLVSIIFIAITFGSLFYSYLKKYYAQRQAYSHLLTTKDMVTVIKYLRKKDNSYQSYTTKLSPEISWQSFDLYKDEYAKPVKIVLYRGLQGLPQTPIEKETSWDSLSIQDKMFLCAYGSSGNKLNREDINQIEKEYLK